MTSEGGLDGAPPATAPPCPDQSTQVAPLDVAQRLQLLQRGAPVGPANPPVKSDGTHGSMQGGAPGGTPGVGPEKLPEQNAATQKTQKNIPIKAKGLVEKGNQRARTSLSFNHVILGQVSQLWEGIGLIHKKNHKTLLLERFEKRTMLPN